MSAQNQQRIVRQSVNQAHRAFDWDLLSDSDLMAIARKIVDLDAMAREVKVSMQQNGLPQNAFAKEFRGAMIAAIKKEKGIA